MSVTVESVYVSPEEGAMVFLVPYNDSGISAVRISRHRFGADGLSIGFYIIEDAANGQDTIETYLPINRIGELVFTTFDKAAAELERRKTA